MRHIKALSIGRPPAPADEIATISALISLASAALGLIQQLCSAVGTCADVTKKTGTQT